MYQINLTSLRGAFIVLLLCAGGTPVFAAADPGAHYTLCKLAKEVRTLRVDQSEPGKCQTAYTKAGKDQTVGQAQNAVSCENILTRVRGNLEKAGWKCREAKASSVSTLPPELQ